jgi:4-hydroxy-tetrahydrodipicolinate reductase
MGKTKVYVAGATGNVGREIVQALIASDDLALVGGWSRSTGQDIGEVLGLGTLGVRTSSDLRQSLTNSAPDVVVDFTSPLVIMANLRIYADLGLDIVVGTTGFDEERLGQAQRWAQENGLRWAIIANFGLSMNLAIDFLQKVRSRSPYVTIIERHYAGKADAPSGTSLWLAKALSTGQSGDMASQESLPGVLGGDFEGVRILSERLPIPGPVGEHEIKLSTQDEIMTIKIAEYSSAVHVDGVLRAVRSLKQLRTGTTVTEFRELVGSA